MAKDRMQKQRFELKYRISEDLAQKARDFVSSYLQLDEMTSPCWPFGNEVILELKFTNRYPSWSREMVEKFGLVRCGAAKYCECVELIGEGQLGHSLDRENFFSQPAPSLAA